MRSRHDDIAAYFAANATTLDRTVARRVVASRPVVEDACSIAWSKLLRRPDVRLGSDGFGRARAASQRAAGEARPRALANGRRRVGRCAPAGCQSRAWG